MTKIPEAIMASARKRAARMYPVGSAGNEAVAEMIAESVLEERGRCALIADSYDQAPGDDTPMGPMMAAQVCIAHSIADEIRKGGL